MKINTNKYSVIKEARADVTIELIGEKEIEAFENVMKYAENKIYEYIYNPKEAENELYIIRKFKELIKFFKNEKNKESM